MELLECWCDVVCFLELESKSCSRVLYFLKSLDGLLGTVSKKSVSIIETRENKGTHESLCCLEGKVLSDCTDLSKGCICGSADVSDVSVNCRVMRKNKTKIPGRGREGYS